MALVAASHDSARRRQLDSARAMDGSDNKGPLSASFTPLLRPQLAHLAPQGPTDGLTIQRRQNRTGMPDGLKTGIESLSGLSMDHVRVHRNSPRPAMIHANAFTQGSHIHVGPGQDHLLSHEAWHLVQQAQGRVSPTVMLDGLSVNADERLEREADVMGNRAEGAGRNPVATTAPVPVPQGPTPQIAAPMQSSSVIQGDFREWLRKKLGRPSAFNHADMQYSSRPTDDAAADDARNLHFPTGTVKLWGPEGPSLHKVEAGHTIERHMAAAADNTDSATMTKVGFRSLPAANIGANGRLLETFFSNADDSIRGYHPSRGGPVHEAGIATQAHLDKLSALTQRSKIAIGKLERGSADWRAAVAHYNAQADAQYANPLHNWAPWRADDATHPELQAAALHQFNINDLQFSSRPPVAHGHPAPAQAERSVYFGNGRMRLNHGHGPEFDPVPAGRTVERRMAPLNANVTNREARSAFLQREGVRTLPMAAAGDDGKMVEMQLDAHGRHVGHSTSDIKPVAENHIATQDHLDKLIALSKTAGMDINSAWFGWTRRAAIRHYNEQARRTYNDPNHNWKRAWWKLF